MVWFDPAIIYFWRILAFGDRESTRWEIINSIHKTLGTITVVW